MYEDTRVAAEVAEEVGKSKSSFVMILSPNGCFRRLVSGMCEARGVLMRRQDTEQFLNEIRATVPPPSEADLA
jgi:hypothetical protein